jgi:hypothetical protein
MVNWNFNVLEMAIRTIHFVQGLSRTPLLFIPRYLTTIFPKRISQNKKQQLDNRKSGNQKIQKPRFTNKCPEVLNTSSVGTLAWRLTPVQLQDLHLRFYYTPPPHPSPPHPTPPQLTPPHPTTPHPTPPHPTPAPN